MANKESSADNLSPDCRKILKNAEDLAVKNRIPFVGTEHILKCLLHTENRIVSWLVKESAVLNKSDVEKKVDEISLLTKSTESQNLYSPSMGRSLEIAGSIWSGHPLPTEGLIIGALLANKDVKNVMGSFLFNKVGELEYLFDNLTFEKKRLELSLVSNEFAWNPQTIPQSKESITNEKAPKPALSTILPGTQEMEKPPASGTHWVIPGRLLCGQSPSRMTSGELSAIVEAGVDTFVCLEESYRTFGCEDYRIALQSLARGSFPPHEVSFLHCPMQDFGVIDDRALIAFISELKQAMEGEHTLYIHCYGGHGRTGTVVLNLLEVMYGVDMKKAMDMLSSYHRMRGCAFCDLNHGKLEGRQQTLQAKRMEPVMYMLHHLHTPSTLYRSLPASTSQVVESYKDSDESDVEWDLSDIDIYFDI